MRRVLGAATYFALALMTFSGALASDAPEVTDNAIGAQYIATLPDGGNKGVVAQFVAASLPDGSAVSFAININGASFEGGPFLYHIHDQPVPSTGNCTATLAHLDPYARGEDPPCNSASPASCQVGDLSGKHGKIPALPGFSANYTDKYVSLTSGAPAFFGNRSIVLHYANKTRIACANFKQVINNSTSGYGSGSGSGSNSTATFLGSPTSTIGLPTPSDSSAASSSGGRGPAGAKPTASSGAMAVMKNAKTVGGETVALGPFLAAMALLVL